VFRCGISNKVYKTCEKWRQGGQDAEPQWSADVDTAAISQLEFSSVDENQLQKTERAFLQLSDLRDFVPGVVKDATERQISYSFSRQVSFEGNYKDLVLAISEADRYRAGCVP
jgi:hypothetical protein